jgi:hypothetical protein
MISHVGRAQMLGIAAVLALFFLTEFAILDSFDAPKSQQAQAGAQR